MATGPRYKVPFRRRREGRTDYYVRRKLLSGRETRAVIRRSSRNISVQFAEFTMDGDTIAVSANSRDIAKMGWTHSSSNICAAYLTGYLAGKRAMKAGIEYAVPDIGMQRPVKGGVLFAVVAGMADAGLEVPHGEDTRPSDERLHGKHIDEKMEADVNGLKKKLEAE